MKPCITCGELTEGSVSVNGRFWAGACQACRNRADELEARSLGLFSKALNKMADDPAVLAETARRMLPAVCGEGAGS